MVVMVMVLLQHLVLIVNEVTTWTVWTKTDGVIGATQFGFVFRMSGQTSQFLDTVSELTLIAVFAYAKLLVWTTEFGLVTRRVYGGWGCCHRGGRRRRRRGGC